MRERESGTRTCRTVTRRCVLATVALLTAMLSSPAPALASRLSSDRVGTVPLSAGTISPSKAPDISAGSGRLVTSNAQSLWSRKPSTRRRMASTTKVMTALIVLESCSVTETVRVTRAASRTPYAMGLRTGEQRSVRRMLEYLLIPSSNDAATALAIHVSGSVPAFARRMNARARQLGLNDTHYVNPHGLDASGHYTTARDLAMLMKVVMRQPEFRRIVKLRSTTLPAYQGRPQRTLRSTNRLLGELSGLQGGKTGYTDDADYCFVASARRNGVTLTSVVLGSPTSRARFYSSRRLLEWGFKHYRIKQLATATQTVGWVPLSDNPSQTVSVRFAETTSAAIFDLAGRVSRRPSLVESVAVPVYAGQPLGEVRLVQGERVLTTVAAVATSPKASAQETVGAIPVTGYADRTVTVRTAECTTPVAPFDASRRVDRVLTLEPQVSAPVPAGQVLGSVTYLQDGFVLVTVPVVAAETVDAPDLADAAGALLQRGWRALFAQAS